MEIIYLAINISILIITLSYYTATKEESEVYKSKSKEIAMVVVLLNLINLVLVAVVDKIEAFIVGQFIGLFLAYAVHKGQLRASQVLADRNSLIGSSILRKEFNWKNIDWKLIIKLNIGFILWTFLVFLIWKPEINPSLLKDIDSLSNVEYVIGILNTTIAIVFLAPIKEELIFRFMGVNLFVHWFGRKNKVSVFFAILIPSLIWMYMHSGVIINYWVKYLQVLPGGLALGYIMYKKDIEHSIILHSVFNLTLFILSIIILKSNII